MNSVATFNPVMTALAAQFMREADGYVGRVIAPSLGVADQSSDYPVWERVNNLNVPGNTKRSPGAPFARTQMKLSDDNYKCEDYGIESPIADTIRKKYRNFFDADSAAVRRNTDTIKLGHETRVFNIVKAASGANVGTKWNAATPDIKGDVDAAAEIIRKNIGIRKGSLRLIIARPVMDVVSKDAKIADRLKYTTPGSTTEAQFAAYLGIAAVLIADQVVNSANEGQALSPADIWDDTGFLFYSDASPDLMRPTFARTFVWKDFSGPDDIQVMSYRDEKIESDVHRSRMFSDEKTVVAEAGYRLGDLL